MINARPMSLVPGQPYAFLANANNNVLRSARKGGRATRELVHYLVPQMRSAARDASAGKMYVTAAVPRRANRGFCAKKVSVPHSVPTTMPVLQILAATQKQKHAPTIALRVVIWHALPVINVSMGRNAARGVVLTTTATPENAARMGFVASVQLNHHLEFKVKMLHCHLFPPI